MSVLVSFRYKAVQPNGKSKQGSIYASSEADAYARLRAENLSPLLIRTDAAQATKSRADHGYSLLRRLRRKSITDQELEDLFRNLAVLLRAGADIRTALGVLGQETAGLRLVSQAILGGSSLDLALAPVIPKPLSHLRGLIAAGEARGDISAGLDSAASVLAMRRKIRQQLFEALSYPAFVFVSAIAALSIILLVVVPAIAPLLLDNGQRLPIYFSFIFAISQGLGYGWPYLLAALLMAAIAVSLGWRFGGLKAWTDRWLLDGPLRSIARSLVYGGYSRALGESLQSGASILDALRLCQRSLANTEARKRTDIVSTMIRQGRTLSDAFREVRGLPQTIVRLCEVGEASSTLGPMLMRAGEREETAALVKIDKGSKLLGPLLIIGLGALIGGLMAGVLTALTDIGSISGA
ncbi:MAG: type II secretion system F family protein [Asticcacaulis sp.]|uniref:type II secretion system F family protein n=1 Tax=Asticcacaulis sp. TaxID=1872648 RepID=UPI003F7BAD24